MKTQSLGKGERGMTLVTVLVLSGALMTSGMVLLDRVAYTAKESNDRIKEQQAFLLAEAGVNKALWWLNTQYKQPTGAILDTTRAPVRVNGATLSLTGNNHPALGYAACSDGIPQPDAVAGVNGFNAHLGGTQTLGGGTYVVNSLILITARVDCFGGTVPRDRDEMWEIRVTGTYQGVSRTATAMLGRPVTIVTNPAFSLYARNQITLTSNIETKSFDSSVATWNPTSKRFENADGTSNECACNSSIGTNARTDGVLVLDSNVRINGAVTPGPGALPSSVRTGSNVVITGATTPAATERTFPPPTPPGGICCTPLPITPPGKVTDSNGVTTYTLPPGNYGDVAINSKDRLVLSDNGPGAVNYSFTSLHLLSNAKLSLEGTASEFKVKVTAATNAFVADSNATINEGGKPDKLTVMATADTRTNTQNADPSNSSVKLMSDASFFGTIYAPNAKVLFDSNALLYGAAVADRLVAGSNAKILYDTNLSKKTGTDYVIGDIIVPYFATNL